VRSVEYCTGLFVWGLEVCAHLVVGGCVCGGSLRCWGFCVFVIKSLRRLWVFSVVIGLDSGNSPNRRQTTSFFSFLSHIRTHTR